MSHVLTVTSTIPEGAEGRDDNPFNPLARATNKLLRDGDPMQKISLCYLDAQDSPGLFPLRWFGVFIHSYGGRLILFPGFAEPFTFMFRSQGQGRPNTKPFSTDHLSLEADMKSWHITSTGSREHEGTFPTHDVGSGRYFWCGISVAGFDRLREVKKEVVTQANVPETDGRRRTDNVLAARDKLVFNTLQLNAEAKRRFTPGFLHFALVVGPCGFPNYSGFLFPNADTLPYVSPKFPPLNDTPVRGHRLNIPPFDVEIISAWLPGTLSVPFLFTS
jgi:hypothetical protein